MIKSFSSEDMKFEEYYTKITQALEERGFSKFINISAEDSEVTIIFNKLGKSELKYNLIKTPHGFECKHKSEKLAIAHRALRKEMEAKFSGVLQRHGATVELA